jgi:preprotein translocase subunit SecF
MAEQEINKEENSEHTEENEKQETIPEAVEQTTLESKEKKETWQEKIKREREERRKQKEEQRKQEQPEKKEEKAEEHKEEKKEEKVKKEIYKKLLIIPLLILILSIAQIGYQTITTGDFVKKDFSLTGGLEITVHTDKEIDINSIEKKLTDKFSTINEIRETTTATGKITGIIITDSNIENREQLSSFLQQELEIKDISVNMVGSSLAASFFKQTLIALLVAFLFMGIVVFISFRVPIPSLAVILAAVSNIIETIAVANIFGMEISTAGIAAFLMLIGYSVDTDILLTTRVLKREGGTVKSRTIDAMKTGILMTATTLTAATAALLITNSEVIRQIMIILAIGLVLDMMNTWIQNAGILRIYMEKKHGKT